MFTIAVRLTRHHTLHALLPAHPEASPSTVCRSRQSMSRGGKLAPEVNRCVRPSPRCVLILVNDAVLRNSRDMSANFLLLP